MSDFQFVSDHELAEFIVSSANRAIRETGKGEHIQSIKIYRVTVEDPDSENNWAVLRESSLADIKEFGDAVKEAKKKFNLLPEEV